MSALAITITRQVAEQMSQALLTLAARQADIGSPKARRASAAFGTTISPSFVRSRIMFARTGEIGDGFTLKHEAHIERLTSATPTQKLGVKVPFTWPLEIQSPQGQRLIVTARYSVPTPGFRVG